MRLFAHKQPPLFKSVPFVMVAEMKSAEKAEMEKHLKYLNSGDPFLMLLMTHAHVESTLRDMCLSVVVEGAGRDLKNAGFGKLLGTAMILNLVSEKERGVLQELATLRNRLAHGWKTEPIVTDEDVDRLWKASKRNPLSGSPEIVEMMRRSSRMRLMSVLGDIGADMREKQRRLERLLPEIRKHRERLTLLHFNPGVIRHLSKEESDLIGP